MAPDRSRDLHYPDPATVWGEGGGGGGGGGGKKKGPHHNGRRTKISMPLLRIRVSLYTPTNREHGMVPGLKCGKGLIMPHGRFYNRPDEVFGLPSGLEDPRGVRQDHKRKNAIWMIRRWEELTANPNSSREECQRAE